MTPWRPTRSLAVVVACALVAGLLAAWVWAGRVQADQVEQRDDLNLFLDASSAGWAEATNQFFGVPESAVDTIAAVAPRLNSKEALLTLLGQTVNNHPTFDSAFIGYPDGGLLFVGRSDEFVDGGFTTREITFDSGERVVKVGTAGRDLVEVGSQVDEDDEFDPRSRPWYQPIAGGSAEIWTDPYVFAFNGEPGITHSVAVRQNDALVAVVGIDIRLTQLSSFLDELRPGPNGEALAVDANAQVIASSTLNDSGAQADRGGRSVVPLGESDDLVRLVETLRVDPDRSSSALVSDRGRTTVARSAGSGSTWYIAIRAFDEDFLGAPTVAKTENAIAIAGIALSASVMAGLAAWSVTRYLNVLRRDAAYDELTGVFTRRALKRKLELGLRSESAVVAIIDLDRFKAINDEHGHLVGDEVLVTLAERIAGFAADNESHAGRLGGDEFMIVAQNDLPWDVLNESLAVPVRTAGGLRFELSGSIGVAHSLGSASLSVDELMSRADSTLFIAKRDGGNQWRVWSDEPPPAAS